MNGEHLLVALMGVKGDSLVPFQTSLDHPINQAVIVNRDRFRRPGNLVLGSGFVTFNRN